MRFATIHQVPPTRPVVYRQALRDSTRWDSVPLRPGDIIVSTPTKCGTTWVQRICALLVFQTPALAVPLDRVSPWVDFLVRPIAEVARDLAAQEHRRFIKTHTPLDGLPVSDDVTYICVGRDPRDVALSWFNHQTNQDRKQMLRIRDEIVGDRRPESSGDAATVELSAIPIPDRFRAWVDDATPPYDSACNLWLTLHHVQTFWSVRAQPNIVLLHYHDLAEDLDGQMRALSGRLGITVDEDRWASLVRAAGLEEMRAAAQLLAPDAALGAWHDNEQFFRRGGRGEWRELLNETELEHYHRRVSELAPPDMVRWLHREPSLASR
jgi:aryl sulfotransferase